MAPYNFRLGTVLSLENARKWPHNKATSEIWKSKGKCQVQGYYRQLKTPADDGTLKTRPCSIIFDSPFQQGIQELFLS